MKCKRRMSVCFVLLLLVCVAGSAFAKGLFPTANEVFGDYVASVPAILGRVADTDATEGTTRTLVFNNFTLSEYEKLSKGLAAEGCTCTGNEPDANNAAFTVESVGHKIGFVYNYPDSVLTVSYPTDVRLKEETAAASGTGILPDAAHLVGEGAPSLAAATGHKTSMSADGGTETCAQAYEKDYADYGTALSNDGWMLTSSGSAGGKVTATLAKGNAKILVTYIPSATELRTEYTQLSYPDGKAVTGGSSILPDLDSVLGTSLPTVAEAIQRLPDSEQTNGKGETVQTYNGFTDGDYNTFSNYLSTTGCSVEGYTLNGDVATINLSKDGNPFCFVYNRAAETATVTYGNGTRPVQTVLATPTPAPTATPKPTAKPTPKPTAAPKYYSPNECYDKAVSYLKNRLKNPNSLILNGNTYYESNGCYVFKIDYSAQNGFGGYNRETFQCAVNYTTGRVEYGY